MFVNIRIIRDRAITAYPSGNDLRHNIMQTMTTVRPGTGYCSVLKRILRTAILPVASFLVRLLRTLDHRKSQRARFLYYNDNATA